MHVRCDNQYKTGVDGENILRQPMLFVCMGICVLSPAHESEMRVYLVNMLIQCIRLDGLIVEFFRGFFDTFSEGSVDLIIYRNYVVNRFSFIYCSLACCSARGPNMTATLWTSRAK